MSNKSSIYENILKSKSTIHIYNQKIPSFNFDLPKKIIDNIFKFYGKKELIDPHSFVVFTSLSQSSTTITGSSPIQLDSDEQSVKILNTSDSFHVLPKSFEKYDENTQMKLAPKLNNKIMKNISKLSGIPWSTMIDYVSVAITTITKTTKIKITIYTIEQIFQLVYFLLIKFSNGSSIDITYYTLKKILKQSGIDLVQILQYLKPEISEKVNRENLSEIKKNLIAAIDNRKLKELIPEKLYKENFEIKKEISCDRLKKSNFDIVIFYMIYLKKLKIKKK